MTIPTNYFPIIRENPRQSVVKQSLFPSSIFSSVLCASAPLRAKISVYLLLFPFAFFTLFPTCPESDVVQRFSVLSPVPKVPKNAKKR